jgi:very-short-patch-repair endonuclease
MSLKRHSNRHELLDRRRDLRQNHTLAERSLWSQLRRDQRGVNFRRQHSKGNFILDFYCPELKLAIEVDGASLDQAHVQNYDAMRQRILEREGTIFLRCKDEEVLHDANRTLGKIDAKIAELKENLLHRKGDG